MKLKGRPYEIDNLDKHEIFNATLEHMNTTKFGYGNSLNNVTEFLFTGQLEIRET